jgi:hypothetical protein
MFCADAEPVMMKYPARHRMAAQTRLIAIRSPGLTLISEFPIQGSLASWTSAPDRAVVAA